jgi:nicotinamide-nucleotide amidase
VTDAVGGAAPRSAESLAAELVERLLGRGWSVAVAESLTGGLVISSLVSVPGASAVVRGGVVAYATQLKGSLLGVDADLLAAEGAVHPDVARQMAERVRGAATIDGTAADVGISTTGVAGPTPQDGKPVGTVFVAVATPAGTRVEALSLTGSRERIRSQATRAALVLALASVR